MDVRFVKLITGEEFLAEVTEKDDGQVEINNTVVAVANETGGMSFMPWCHFVMTRKFNLDADDIIFTSNDYDSQMRAAYEENFNPSRILTPGDKKILMP